MSLASAIGPAALTREAILTALAEVPILHVYPSAPDTPSAWDAYPRWVLTNYTGGRLSWLAVHEYDVLVILPAGYEPDTVAQGDSVLDQVAAALMTVGVVQAAEPVQLVFAAGVTVPALRVHVVPRLNPNT